MSKEKTLYTGLIPSPRDDRDYILSSSMPTVKRYPKEKPLPFDLDIHDQTIIPSCVGMSCAAIKEGSERLEKVDKVFDGHWIYYKCKEIDNYSGKGTYLRTGFKVLKDTGAKPSDVDPDKLSEENPIKYRIKAYARVDDISFEGLKKALSIYHFLVAGFKGSNEGWKEELIRPPKEGESEWGHAVTLVGYDEDHIIGQNSWGDYSWVHNDSGGYFKTTKDYLPFEAWAVLLDKPNEISTVKDEVKGYVAYEFTKVEEGEIMVNTSYGLRLREEPTTESLTLEVLPDKTKIKTTGELSYSNGWNWLPVLKN